MIQGIILAGGFSSRFPAYKMTQYYIGKTIIQHSVEGMLKHVDTLFVVTGYQREKIEAVLQDYPVTFIYNDDYKQGMFTSIKAGVAAIEAERFFIMPGDQPIVKATTYEALLQAKGDVVIPSYHMKAGHPVLISGRLKNKLLQSDNDHLKAFLSTYDKQYVVVDDAGICIDIDTPENLKELIGGME